MNTKFRIGALALTLAAGGCAQMAPHGSDARLDQIDRQHSAALEHCADLKGTSRDVCRAEADERKEVARAQIKVAEDDTPKNRLELAKTRADAELKVAKARCKGQVGNAKDNCERAAATRHDNALAEAQRQSQTVTAIGSSGTGGSSASGAPAKTRSD